MTHEAWPFDNQTVTEAMWAAGFGQFMRAGIFLGVRDSFEPQAVGGRLVEVGSGFAFVDGHWCSDTTATQVTIPPAGVESRIDRIVIRANRETNTCELTLLVGEEDSLPVPPALERTDDVFDVPVCRVVVPGGSSAVDPSDVIDERRFATTPGPAWSTAAQRPAASDVGPQVWWFTTDTNQLAFSDGADWIVVPLQVDVAVDGTVVGTRGQVNLIAGRGIVLDGADNAVDNRVDVSITTQPRHFYGDGSDGDDTVSSNRTLDRDYYFDNLTINAGVTVNTAGFRLFVRGKLAGGGTIANNGGNASGATAGQGAPSGTLGAGSNGGNGASGVGTGSNGSAISNAIGGTGGGSGSGQIGGAVTNPTAAVGGTRIFRELTSALRGRTLDGTLVNGGSGGAGGSGQGGTGGGGGGGGGVVLVAAAEIDPDATLTIRANGGNGGNSASGGAGGGGGGGGVVVLVTQDEVPSGVTLEAKGGNGGSGSQGSNPGQAGASGLVVTIID